MKPSGATLTTVLALGALGLGTWGTAHGQNPTTRYASMAPVAQYLMTSRAAEIALARSAAPDSISRDAQVLVLGAQGYESAASGTNGFVCVVERSWTSPIDAPEFWNPTIRSPICFNAAAARSYLPLELRKTRLVLAGLSKAQMADSITAGLDQKTLPALEAGAMCYMLSKRAHLSDRDGRWHPHLMFFVPERDSGTWGANLPGSPILAAADAPDRVTIFMVPVARWSDGTPDQQAGR